MEKNRKKRVGRVISNKMDKTAVVQVETKRRHRLYKRVVKQISKFVVHDEDNGCQIGDLVQIVEHRPISKRKRWIVTDIIARKEVVTVPETEVEVTKIIPEVEKKKVEEPAAEEETTANAEPEEEVTADDAEEEKPAATEEVASEVEPEEEIKADDTEKEEPAATEDES